MTHSSLSTPRLTSPASRWSLVGLPGRKGFQSSKRRRRGPRGYSPRTVPHVETGSPCATSIDSLLFGENTCLFRLLVDGFCYNLLLTVLHSTDRIHHSCNAPHMYRIHNHIYYFRPSLCFICILYNNFHPYTVDELAFFIVSSWAIET